MEKKDLEKMTVTKLREEAMKHPEEIQGAHGMSKEDLIPALMKVMNIPEPEEEKKSVGTKRAGKSGASATVLKGKIQALKEERRKALEAKDYQAGALLRRRIHHLKRQT